MSQELATNALTGLEGLGAGLRNTIKGAPQATDFTALKLKNGRWLYGAANTEISADSSWLFDPRTVEHGWICWKKRAEGDKSKAGPPLGHRMVPFSDPKPEEKDLPYFADGDWAEQYLVKVVCVSGDEAGTELLYQSSAQGMIEQLVNLLVKIENRIAEGKKGVLPVVKLRTTDYNHPVWGQTFKPEFKIDGWINVDDAPKLESKTAAVEAPMKKKKKKDKGKVIDAEPVTEIADEELPAGVPGGGETEAPVMRRRRRA